MLSLWIKVKKKDQINKYVPVFTHRQQSDVPGPEMLHGPAVP